MIKGCLVLTFLACIMIVSSNTRNLASGCATTDVTLADGSCLKCGTNGTFTKAKKSSSECTCSSTLLTWNTAGRCDCGSTKALVFFNNAISCAACDQTTNSAGQADFKTCTCINPDISAWNATLKRCECPFPSVFVQGSCIPCDVTIFSKGANPKKIGECNCGISAMVWDAAELTCKCPSNNTVAFAAKQIVSCNVCNSKLNAVTGQRVSFTECACPDGLIWLDNFGCICPNPNQFMIKGTVAKCISCDDVINADGVAKSGKTCNCLFPDAYKWDSTLNKCKCPKKSQVPVEDLKGNIQCYECNNKKNFTSLPVVDNKCSCINSSKLLWNPLGFCECINSDTEVYVTSVSAAVPSECVKCTELIYASGVNPDRPNTCMCLDPALNYSNGLCSCPKASQAFIINSIGQYLCVDCSKKQRGFNGRKSITECKCISKDLIWDSSIGFCRCPDGKFPFGSGATLKCVDCAGRYVQPGVLDPANASLCACIQDNMVFKVSKTGVPSCRCPGTNSIFDYDLNCLVCNVKPNSTSTQSPTQTVSQPVSAPTNPPPPSDGSTPPPPPPNGTANGTANGTSNGTAPPPPPPNGTASGTANGALNGTTPPPPPQNGTANGTLNGTAPPPGNGTNPPSNETKPPRNDTSNAPNGLAGDPLGPFECKCASDSFWNDNLFICVKCSSDPNSKSAGNALSCICKTGYIWDVISNSCISPCAAGDMTCLDCTAVINTDGSAAALAQTLANNTRAAFDGSNAILKLVNITTTNYGKISKNQCQCLEGFIWDGSRMKCLSQNLL